MFCYITVNDIYHWSSGQVYSAWFYTVWSLIYLHLTSIVGIHMLPVLLCLVGTNYILQHESMQQT